MGFSLLYAFIIVRLDRRELVWINVTQHPSAEWIARQITDAFPWDEAPTFAIRLELMPITTIVPECTCHWTRLHLRAHHRGVRPLVPILGELHHPYIRISFATGAVIAKVEDISAQQPRRQLPRLIFALSQR